MAVPAWSGSVILNYRQQFKEKYGRDSTLSDEDVFEIFETVFNDEDTKQEDDDRVGAMMDREMELKK